MAVGERRPEHVLELVLVLGSHDDHVGHVPEIGDVVDPLVCGPVVGDDARPVEGEDDGQVHQTDVVIDLVVGPLEEGRVDGYDGLEPRDRQAGGEGHGMLFGDPDIEEALGKLLGKLPEARPLAHGRGDGQDLLVFPSDLDQSSAKDAGKGGPPFALLRLARRDLERSGAVEFFGVRPGRLVAFAFLRHALDEDRPVVRFGQLEGLDEGPDAVALDRADIADAELREDKAREDRLLDELFQGPPGLDERPADLGDGPEDGLSLVLDPDIMLTRNEIGEVFRPGPDVDRDGHLVVVEDDDQALAEVADLIERFEGNAARQAAVADDGDNVVLLPRLIPGDGHTQGR